MALAHLGVVAGPSLNNLYYNPAYARDDYRGIAAWIQQAGVAADSDDAVLFLAPNQWEVFTYYFPATNSTIPLTYRPLNAAAVDAQMRDITRDKRRLFVLFYAEGEADPAGWYERWLAQHAFKADQQWIGNIRLAVYGVHNETSLTQRRDVNARFGNQLELVSIWPGDNVTRVAHVGEIVPLRLSWRALVALKPRYKVFVHIGRLDAPPVAQTDSEPMQDFRSTDTWPPGQTFEDWRAVWLKPGTPAGQYALFIGLYDPDTGQRLILPDGSDRLKLGEIEVRPTAR
jgi:hypothetical protein